MNLKATKLLLKIWVNKRRRRNEKRKEKVKLTLVGETDILGMAPVNEMNWIDLLGGREASNN